VWTVRQSFLLDSSTSYPHILIRDGGLQSSGAIKATGGRGLQPAMDHILENEGKPVPDLSAISSSASGSSAQPMDVDEDAEDAEALRALTGKAGSTATDAEAKVH